MAEKLKPGDAVRLTHLNGETLPDVYEFVEYVQENGRPSRTQIRLRGPDGIVFRAHRSRIGRQESGRTEGSAVGEATKDRRRNMKKEIKTFDLDAWIESCGGVHLAKQSPFNHSNYSLISHVVVNAKRKTYFVLNTYVKQDGTISVGKNATGSRYPLKGKKFIVAQKGKDGVQKKELRGSMTAEEAIEHFLRKGYAEVRKTAEATTEA